MIQKSEFLWALAIANLYWSRFAAAAGVADGFCASLAQNDNNYEVNYLDGISILMVPYTWCLDNCAGWTAFSAKDVALVLFQFILPTVIFALVVPRKWHLDLSPTSFDLTGSFPLLIAKLLASFIAVGIVASVDMIIWISVILALAGPMILSGVEEMYLDFISIRALQNTGAHGFTPEERVSLLIALLCGNFDDHGNGAATNLNTTLSTYAPATPGTPTLYARKAQLSSIMNGQANFGSSIGIATLFFLAGFIYNALSITNDTVHGINWTPYAVWLMSMVFVAVVSATLLTGNNPSVATVLVGTTYQHDDRPWYYLLADYYEGELYPVFMYDRGIRKMLWLQQSAAARHPSYQQVIYMDYWAWAWIGLPTMFLTLFPSIMGYSMANRLPFPRQGCRTFTYLLYMCCQVLLVLISVQRNSLGESLFSFPSKTPGWKILYGVVVMLAILATFMISLLGSIFQIFGVYNNCFCQNSVSKWTLPASQRWTELGGFDMTDSFEASNHSFAVSMVWAAAGLTGVVCYLGFWYQKMLRRAVAVELAQL
ncbi:hypothetical protein MMC12_000431 [Toensbergia leucococca]|nr:hypothetical protein [Toensbergia leucococca]